MSEIILTSRKELEQIINNSVLIAMNDFKAQERDRNKFKVYTLNQASKLLHMSYNTLKKHIETGLLKTTKDNRITEYEINNFLSNK